MSCFCLRGCDVWRACVFSNPIAYRSGARDGNSENRVSFVLIPDVRTGHILYVFAGRTTCWVMTGIFAGMSIV